MDAVSLVMRALEAGNEPDIGIEAMIPDDYRFAFDNLTQMVAGKLLEVGQPTLLENYMAQPDVYDSALAEVLEEAGVDEDGALIDAAQEFMSIMDIRSSARGGYTVDIDEDTDGFV